MGSKISSLKNKNNWGVSAANTVLENMLPKSSPKHSALLLSLRERLLICLPCALVKLSSGCESELGN